VSHLFYADDALIFCEAETSQIRHLRAILTIFEGISGLHVNWLKSHISPINQVWNLQDLAVILGCQVESLPTKYLGLPLGAKNKELEVWSGVLERCENKLSRWKSQYLSLGGRLTLTKSVLDGMPTYMMSLFPIPKSIEKKLNRVRRAFLWQGNKEKRGYNLVKWDELTLNTQQGGLNLKNLSKQNTSLLQKWLWRFSSEERAIWRRFIAGKYGLLNHWTTEEVAGTFGCSVWKTIRRLWPHFNNNMSITVGNGLKTDFWNEVWIGEDSLRNSFSHLYTLSTQRNVSASQAWSQQGWDLVFRRALNDWEIGEVANLLGVLNSHPALSMRPDKPRWKLHNKGVFTVKSCYWNLNTRQSMVDIWPWKLIWKTKCPPKVACFCWLVCRKACLTHEALQKRGWQFCSRCVMCEQETEVNDHLFLHCKAAVAYGTCFWLCWELNG